MPDASCPRCGKDAEPVKTEPRVAAPFGAIWLVKCNACSAVLAVLPNPDDK